MGFFTVNFPFGYIKKAKNRVPIIDFVIKILYNIKCIRIFARGFLMRSVSLKNPGCFYIFYRKSDFMLLDLIQSGFETSLLVDVLLSIPIILLSLSVHESVHGIAANALGDPTARNLGRITLNPAKHFDLYGFIAMLVFGFGWAKPVPINTRYMKNGKWGFTLSALAGPCSNFFLAFVMALLYMFSVVAMTHIAAVFGISGTLANIIMRFFEIGIVMNVSLTVFNLLPVPPLDGSRLLTALIPRRWATFVFRYEQYFMIGLFVLLYLGAFSGILSAATGAVTGFIIKTVNLIPFDKMINHEGAFKIMLGM